MAGDKASESVICYIGLGSNLGDRETNLRQALERLQCESQVQVKRVSRFYETDPVGGPPQGRYLNAAAELWTRLPPAALLDELLKIEEALGRVRTVKWGPRTIDLDLLLYGEAVVETPRLTVPHPRMHERRFVLEPLCEIAPQAVHPKLQKTVSQLWKDLMRSSAGP